jgi:methyl-accepting chemotaxis protein
MFGKASDADSIVRAINETQAVVQFSLDGTIQTANANFLNLLGYRLDEVVGKHHKLFVEPGAAKSDAYRTFWEALRRGEPQTAEFKRIGKSGQEVWIQASYTPIIKRGKVQRIIKFATDVTEHVLANLAVQSFEVDTQGMDSVSFYGGNTSHYPQPHTFGPCPIPLFN